MARQQLEVDNCLSKHQWVYLLLLSTVFCSSWLVYNFGSQLQKCSPAPFFYVTLHDKPHNIVKLSRDGCVLSMSALEKERNSYLRYIETDSKHVLSAARLRMMAVGKYKGREALYVANAKAGRDEILVYSGTCNRFGQRHLLDRAVTRHVDGDFIDNKHSSLAMEHPYGLTFDDDGNLYVSTQHTDLVLRYLPDSFLPLSSPDLPPHTKPPTPQIISSHISPGKTSVVTNVAKQIHNGSFVDFSNLPGSSGKHRPEGVRGIAYVHGNIWVAHEDINGILVVDTVNGTVIYVIAVEKPISLLLDSIRGVVFVGVKGSHSRTQTVYAVDAKSMLITQSYNHDKARHATGMVVYEDTLYVADQAMAAIIMFDVDSGKYRGILRHMPEIEGMLLSDC